MKKINKIIILFLVISLFPLNVLGANLKWPEKDNYGPNDNFSDKLRIRFRPLLNYTCNQNPPDFSWRPIPKATKYELQVAKDKEINNIVKTVETKNPFYNFTTYFEPGVYYWRVRYFKDNNVSSWSMVRRFRIDDDAKKVKFETPEEIFQRVWNLKRPVSYNFTKEEINKIKNDKEKNNFYLSYKNNLLNKKQNNFNVDTTIEYSYGDGGGAGRNTFFSEVSKARSIVTSSLFVYSIDKDIEIANYGIMFLNKLCEFNYPPFDAHTDTYISQTFEDMAKAYDVFYDLLKEDEKIKIKNVIAKLVKSATDKLYVEKGRTVWETNPAASHEWGIGERLIITSVLMKDELPLSREIVEFLLPLYINISSAHTIEDGTYQQGTGYLRYANDDRHMFFKRTGIFDFYTKLNFENKLNQYLYLYPVGSRGGFGDESYQPSDYYSATTLDYISRIYNNPVALWMKEENGNNSLTQTELMLLDKPTCEKKPPYGYAKSKYFKDGGFAAFHSDLIDKDRVSLLFRSSWWGSMGHCHPDQNSFIINAYGESLAIDSGFYPWMGSPHHANYATKTYAHNAITIDNGRGQFNADIDAEGKITSFISHPLFELVSGDASNAYKEGKHDCPKILNKAKRDIIYLHPDSFIVIDDLEALPNKKSSFEFWLNAENIDLLNNNEAKITKGNANLYAKTLCPKVTGEKLDGFCGPDKVIWPKEIDGDVIEKRPDPVQPKQQRVYFKTDPLSETKMVTLINVTKNNVDNKDVLTEDNNNYTKIIYPDNTVVYINKNKSPLITDNLEISGEALVLKDNSYMLISGTKLIKNGRTLISSDVPISATVSDKAVSISTLENDCNVKIYEENIERLKIINENKVREMEDNNDKYGVLWNKNNNFIDLSLYPGSYSFYLNNNNIEGIYEAREIISGNGSVTSDKKDFMVQDENITYKIKPDNGYYTSKIKLNGKDIGAFNNLCETTYKTPPIKSDVNLEVEFKKIDENPYDIKILPDFLKMQNGYIIFGKVVDFNKDIKEIGIISDNKKYPFKGDLSDNGFFGIRFVSNRDLFLTDTFITPYLKTNNKEISGEKVKLNNNLFDVISSDTNITNERVVRNNLNDIKEYNLVNPYIEKIDRNNYKIYCNDYKGIAYFDILFDVSYNQTVQTINKATDFDKNNITTIKVTARDGTEELYNFKYIKKTGFNERIAFKDMYSVSNDKKWAEDLLGWRDYRFYMYEKNNKDLKVISVIKFDTSSLANKSPEDIILNIRKSSDSTFENKGNKIKIYKANNSINKNSTYEEIINAKEQLVGETIDGSRAEGLIDIRLNPKIINNENELTFIAEGENLYNKTFSISLYSDLIYLYIK